MLRKTIQRRKALVTCHKRHDFHCEMKRKGSKKEVGVEFKWDAGIAAALRVEEGRVALPKPIPTCPKKDGKERGP